MWSAVSSGIGQNQLTWERADLVWEVSWCCNTKFQSTCPHVSCGALALRWKDLEEDQDEEEEEEEEEEAKKKKKKKRRRRRREEEEEEEKEEAVAAEINWDEYEGKENDQELENNSQLKTPGALNGTPQGLAGCGRQLISSLR